MPKMKAMGAQKSDWTKGFFWSKDNIYWSFGSTLYISVIFTWMLPYAKEVAEKWTKGRVIAGGPAVYLNPEYVEKWATINMGRDIEPIDPLAMHNPMACFTSRGCVNKCKFCAVPKIEGEYREIRNFNVKPIVCDNNFLSCSEKHFNRAIDKLKRLPFVDIQGVEAKKVTREKVERLSELKKVKLRVGFDHIKYEKYVVNAVKKFQKKGMKDILCYVLIGFKDTPEDAHYRMNKVIELGAKPYPMRYQPLFGKEALLKNSHVDPNWTEYELKKMQSYYANLNRFSHIPYDEFGDANKEQRSKFKGFNL